jgi:pyruvate dehydrogenase E2 component (dihydrolipoamide acetyltransferase)
MELGVDLASVGGTGPGGRVQLSDIEQAASHRAARGDRMRQAIAAAMTRSAREIPHFHLVSTVDMTRGLSWLRTENERRSIEARLLPGVLLLKAAALALREVPELNATWAQDHVELRPSIHLGVAISLRDGLVAPALHDAHRQTLDELMRNFQDLVNRARAGTLRSSELSESTATVTSLGDQGADTVVGVIYPPQVALIGFGKIVERPWLVGGRVEACPVVNVTLTADHRVVDGRRGSLYLLTVDRLLQEPEGL